MRLSRLLVLPQTGSLAASDVAFMRDTAQECLLQRVWHMPKHMKLSIYDLATEVLTETHPLVVWDRFTFMCLMAAQERPSGESHETIHLRRELETIFFELLYGSQQ